MEYEEFNTMYDITQQSMPTSNDLLKQLNVTNHNVEDNRTPVSGNQNKTVGSPRNGFGWQSITITILSSIIIIWLAQKYFRGARRARAEKASSLRKAETYIECVAKTKGIEIIDTDTSEPSITVKLKDPTDIYKIPASMDIGGYTVYIHLDQEQAKELER